MIKTLVIAILGLLTAYAPLELTRLIIGDGLTLEFIGELAIMWGLYLGALILLTKVVKV